MKLKDTFTNCGEFTIYSNKSRTAWETMRFHHVVGGKRGGVKSLDSLAKKLGYSMESPITNINDAKRIIEEAIQKNIIEVPVSDTEKNAFHPERESLKSFIENYAIKSDVLFTWLNSYQKKKISPKAFEKYTSSYNRHINDKALSPTITLENASESHIRAMMSYLRTKGCSEAVVHNCIMLVRKTYLYAIKGLHLPLTDPTAELFTIEKPKVNRDLYKKFELRALLTELESRTSIPSFGSYHKRVYVATKLLIHTGMRLGELRALTIDKVNRLVDDNGKKTKIFKITIDSTWDDCTKTVKPPKNEDIRTIFVFDDLAKMLIDLYEENPEKNGFIFWKDGSKTEPIEKGIFYDYVYAALEAIGIDKAERKRRHLNIHSFRHFFTTEFEALATFKAKGITGHRSDKAHKNYLHYSFIEAVNFARLSRDLLAEIEDEDLKDVY